MKNSIFLIFVLVAVVVCDEDFNDLVATHEVQNLTSPSLEGITRPHDFKWRIWLNTTEPYPRLYITLHYLNVPETKNCTGSYLEVITAGNYSFGKKCTDIREEMFYGSGSYLMVIYHVGLEDGTHDFKMSYIEGNVGITCILTYFPIPLWAVILMSVLVVGFIIITCCCVKQRCRKRNQNNAKKTSHSSKTDKVPAFVLAGPPSYDDVIKGDNKPPPYSSVVLA